MVDLTFSREQQEFREEVRTWLNENKPTENRPHDFEGIREHDLGWQRTQYDGGWAGISWPEEYGGRGLSTIEQLIWHEEYGRAGLPGLDATFVGLHHAGPTIMARGDDDQKSEHLGKILRGEVMWCQGFSEPDAGSDLASLSTRAVIDGDELVVNGQKIWTSFGHMADWQELLVRTDSSVKKHHGISWVICDMRTPGIEVRPIKTMDGEAEFAEVFYDDVRIPLRNVVGGINHGWDVAMSTLAFERGTAFTASQVQLASLVEELIEIAKVHTGPDGKRPAIKDEEIARRLAMARAEVTSLRAMAYVGISRAEKTGSPGAESSILKVYYSELHKHVAQLAMDLIGVEGFQLVSKWTKNGWTGEYLASFCLSIGGGTSEIQRNIIGERLLGLPR